MTRLMYATGTAIALSLNLAGPAVAAPVSLACSPSQGEPPSMFLTVDVSTGIVEMNLGRFQARVTAATVSWRIPASNLNAGEERDYELNRTTGELAISGPDGFFRAYNCQPGARPPIVLP